MKKALKLFVCSFLLLGVFGCSNSNDQSNTKSDKKDTEVKEETNKADDKNTINTKDDTKTTATLEEKYNQLQKALEKEDGYVVDDQLSYKEDEAEGLKYTQCIPRINVLKKIQILLMKFIARLFIIMKTVQKVQKVNGMKQRQPQMEKL